MTTATRAALNIAAIAAALPGEWTGTGDDNHATDETRGGDLVRADGLALYAIANSYGNKGKVTFSHNRPKFKKGAPWVDVYDATHNRIPAPSINCTLTKSPEQMASDIARRMLADCERVDRLAREKIAQYEAADNAQLETLKALSSALGLSDYPRQYKDTAPRFNLNFDGANGSGSMEIRGGDCVCVEMRSLTRAQALSLVEWAKVNA
jgi:hypothetical protein